MLCRLEPGKRFQRLLHQQNIEHKERTRIDRYTYRRFGDQLFSGVPLNTFMDATEAEIWNIIKLSPVKVDSPLNSYLCVHWILDVKQLLLYYY